MKTRKNVALYLGVGLLAGLLTTGLLSTPLQATTIVDDSFADGDFAKTGALDTPWWTSSSSSGKEISPGSLGLVTGTSGRGIHTIFPIQTLANIGNILKVSYTYTTPATVGTNKSTAFRVGLFDSLGRAGLNADVSASSGSPNDLYGWGFAVGGTGTQTLPGYMFDHDVNNGPTTDLNFREHIQTTATGTGRLMATTSNFDNISPSGPDEGYVFTADTTYNGMFQITRISATDFRLDGVRGGVSYTNTDSFDSDSFDMLGFHVNSNTFGSTSSKDVPDNGIDFSNIKIEFLVPEPSSIALVLGAMTLMTGMIRRR